MSQTRKPAHGAAVAAELERRLRQAFAPTWLEVRDESERHHGHAGWRQGGGTHFAVTIIAQAFSGLSRLERQRRVFAVVGDLLGCPIHALQISARGPDEAGEGCVGRGRGT